MLCRNDKHSEDKNEKFGKFAAALAVMVAAIGMMGCAQPSGGSEVKQTVATPTFSVAAGAVNSGTSVTLSCATEGAVIHYTTDGSEPTAESSTYSNAISVTPPMTIKAIAVKSGMNNSEVASASYLIIPTKDTCVPGDFVLKDGTMLPKDITLSATQKSNVAAVIVRAKTDDKPALGVGIVHNKTGLVWCTSSAVGDSTNITALQGDLNSEWDGSDSWAKVKAACSDATDADASKYPAFEYCLKYGTTNGLTGILATGWYLPTLAELKTINDNNKNNNGVIEASLTKAGGNTFGSSWYWSCCQYPSYYFSARVLYFPSGGMNYYNKSSSNGYVCSVRAFN